MNSEYKVYSLKPYNTFGLDVQTKNIIAVKNKEELLETWQKTVTCGEPVYIIGEGSNIVFLEDFKGTIILNRIMGRDIKEQKHFWLLHVGAGENWHRLVQYTLENNMPGLENLVLIPGCAGSAPVQNIGAYGVEFKQFCQYVDCIELATGRFIQLNSFECKFGHRDSIFKQHPNYYAITAIGLCLPKLWIPVLNYSDLNFLLKASVTPYQIFEEVCRVRRKKIPNPEITGNAGSFFKNPVVSEEKADDILKHHQNAPRYLQTDGRVKLAAGWLIEQCGLKGYKIGGASVHHQHALVIINKENATGADIVAVAKHVRKCVGDKFDVWLEPEVRFVGSCGEVDPMNILT